LLFLLFRIIIIIIYYKIYNAHKFKQARVRGAGVASGPLMSINLVKTERRRAFWSISVQKMMTSTLNISIKSEQAVRHHCLTLHFKSGNVVTSLTPCYTAVNRQKALNVAC